MSILGCYGCVLEIDAATVINGLSFKAFIDGAASACRGPATGEGLEAQEWASDGYVMLIGTEGAEILRARLPSTVVLPDDPINYSRDSLSIQISEIPKGESSSLHFVVAWNKLPESVESSCWFAVDQAHLMVRNNVLD
jgi:hypothetical protein